MKIMFYTNNHLGDVVIMTAVIANLKSCYPEIEFGSRCSSSLHGSI